MLNSKKNLAKLQQLFSSQVFRRNTYNCCTHVLINNIILYSLYNPCQKYYNRSTESGYMWILYTKTIILLYYTNLSYATILLSKLNIMLSLVYWYNYYNYWLITAKTVHSIIIVSHRNFGKDLKGIKVLQQSLVAKLILILDYV